MQRLKALAMGPLLLALGALPNAWCQMGGTPPPSTGMRYVLVVETSRGMQRRTAGTLQTLKAVFDSGLKAQVQTGDQLVLWSFDEDLYTNRFPVLECGPKNLPAVTAQVLEFIQSQRYYNRPSLVHRLNDK